MSFSQDSIHVATKLRNRLLKPSNAQVSVSHLKILISNFPKDSHGLVMSDVCPEDRQNYSAFEKISDPQVLNQLRERIIGSEATATYLEMSRAACSSFIENGISPQERVKRTWHALYFFRAWRAWIKKSSEYNLETNFISSNAFSCMEINAFALIHLIIKFRDEDKPDFFLPTLFTSQTCEKTFRQMRSMTSINWTRINFSLLELFHIASRIELINEIVHYKLNGKNVVFPRTQQNNLKSNPSFPLPTDDEIQNILHQAQQEALADASKLGMYLELSDIIQCPLIRVPLKELDNVKQNVSDERPVAKESIFTCNSLRDYTRDDIQLDGDSKFIQVFNDDGTSKCVLKSSVLWLLTQSQEKLSKDRLSRVRGTTTPRKRKLSPQVDLKRRKVCRNSSLYIADELRVGDWCLFSQKEINGAVIGAITGFKYIAGKTERDKQYSLDFAPVKIEEKDANNRGINVSATWFKIDESLKLEAMNNSHFFININRYLATALSPIYDPSSNSYSIPGNTYDITEEIQKLLK